MSTDRSEFEYIKAEIAKGRSFWKAIEEGHWADWAVGTAVYPTLADHDKPGPTDWSVDPYDASIELKGCPLGYTPDSELLERLKLMGINLIFVSLEDATAYAMRLQDDGSYSRHSCHAANLYRDKKGLWAQILNKADSQE